MTGILTITLNPALDISTEVPAMVPDRKMRCAEPVYDAGGGGVNVARAITFLGGKARAFVALGGLHGQQFLRLLERDGVDAILFDTAGETRQSLAVTDRATGQQFRFVMPGPEWTPALQETALDAIEAVVPKGGVVVLSGSQPLGLPLDYSQQICTRVAAAGGRLLLDTSPPALDEVLHHGGISGHILRLDQAEAEALAGRSFGSIPALADYAHSLVESGLAAIVIFALGAKGSVLATKDARWHAVTPPVPVKSKVGAGDSFVGGFAMAYERGDPLDQALRLGVAAASAAVMTDATRLCAAKDVADLFSRCVVKKV